VAVGAVIVDRDRVLLVRRAQEPLKGEWSLPGGVVELGESLEQALSREVLEETGLQIEVVKVVETLSSIVRAVGQVRYHYVIIDFLCKLTAGTLVCSSDASEARWVSRERLAEFNLTPAAIRVIEKAFDGE
jgi:8-oxo-dGTP diphosphatase